MPQINAPGELQSNTSQTKAVHTTECPVLIIAGPGSGKTKTLVDRVIHLVCDMQVPSENILLATFTEKAAKELVTRISNKAMELNITINISDMYIGTLHSIFLRILEEYRQHTTLKRSYRVLDDFEQKYLIYRNLKMFSEIQDSSLLLEGNYGWNAADTLSSLVNKVSEENIDLEKLRSCTGSAMLPVLATITESYRTLLGENNALDYSMIQTYMWNLLSDEYVLAELRKKIRYLMIDEYQDTNRIQEKILLKIAAPLNRICVVGDDDQALYRFRGATVENILRFQKNFAKNECIKIELSDNYRSHPAIVDFYNKWMNDAQIADKWTGENDEQYRYPKTIKASGKQVHDNNDYNAVLKINGADDESWFAEFYTFIMQAKESGLISDYNQIALLCYSVKNKHIAALADFLEKKGIPVFSPRSALFFERQEIQLIIGAYVFLFPNLVDTYLRTPQSKDKEVWAYYEKCCDLFSSELRNEPDKNRMLRQYCVQKARDLNNLHENTNYTFADIFYELLQFPLFSRYISVDLQSGVQDTRPIYNLALFSRLITQFEYLNQIIVLRPENIAKDIRALFNYYLNFLYDGGIAEYEDFDMTTPSGCISFMTIHQSKGLQFPVTCVASLERVPAKQFSDLDTALADYYFSERQFEPAESIKYFDFWRLYYTAFSRAQNILILTGVDNSSSRAKGEKTMPSKYFTSAWRNAQEWSTLFEKPLPVLETVTAANIKHEYSFTSHVLMYETCPRQYKFFRDLEFTPVRTTAVMFGTLVHETIEDVHKAVLEGQAEKVIAENIENWMNENYHQLSKLTGLYLHKGGLEKVLEHVNTYVDYAKTDWSRIKEAEVPVTLQQTDYILEGKIDLVQGKDNTVEIVDFKTEKKPDLSTEEGKEKLRRYRRQLELYSYIVQNRYGEKVSHMHLFYTGSTDESPFISYDFNEHAIDRTISEIDGVVQKIQKKDFDIDPHIRCKKLCGECDLKAYCNTL